MNINDSQRFTERLAQLSPASSDMDSRRVFFEAGFKAGEQQTAPPTNSLSSSTIAVCLMALALVATTSFYVGANRAANGFSMERLATQSIKQATAPNIQDEARPTQEPGRPHHAESPQNESTLAMNPVPMTPDGNDADSGLANHKPIMRDLSQWAQTLLPRNRQSKSKLAYSMMSAGSGLRLSASADTAKLLDGITSANTTTETERWNADRATHDPQFTPTPTALLKYFNSLETVQ